MAQDELRSLLHLRDAPSQDCGAINALLDEHIGHVGERIRGLRALEKDPKALRARCSALNAIEACGILNELDGVASQGSSASPHRRIGASAHRRCALIRRKAQRTHSADHHGRAA